MRTDVSDALGQWLAITPNRDPGARLSLSFLDFHVYSSTSSTDYQTTVGSYVFAAASRLTNRLHSKKRRQVHILRGFDGLSGVSYFDKWRNSSERAKVKSQLAEMKEELQSKPRLHPPELLTEYAASRLSQLLIVSHRAFQEYWRDTVYIYSKAALSVGVGFFNGFSFYMAPLDIQELTSILFSIFLLTFIFNNIDQQIIPRFINARQLFEARERPSKTYSWLVFIAANVTVEVV
ncbi:hypothetical protein F5X98DRAFT_372842 [Xylaria grammica]|nr:hypothetical protein F5X98DRAFT_372842 [Xylaria grammica]